MVYHKVVGALLPLILAGCVTGNTQSQLDAAENERIATSFFECRNDALTLEQDASGAPTPAMYHQSAEILAGCVVELGVESRAVGQKDQMQTHALMIQQYMKAGAIDTARVHLQTYRSQFSGQDLYYDDGSSVGDTLSLLLEDSSGDTAWLNVSPAVKAEQQRLNYWASH